METLKARAAGWWGCFKAQRVRRLTVSTCMATGLMLPVMAAYAQEVPVDTLAPWDVLKFSGIEPNAVSIHEGALRIKVNDSASPLIYRFDKSTRVTGFRVRAAWQGEIKLPDSAVQGEKGVDDFVLKFGLVQAGEKTLNWFQRGIAADWVKRLYALAPSGAGVQKIHFYSTTQQTSLLGNQRVHPLSDLLYETRITLIEQQGPFELVHQFETPVVLLGLWISSDGDDTGSRFDLEIRQISLRTEK